MSKQGGRKGRRPVADTGVRFGASGSVSQILPLAVHQHQQGNLDRAKVLYEQILDLDPGHADGLQYFGILCHQMGDTERAEALIRQAIGINPRVAPYYDNLGSVLEARDDFEQALAAYEQAEALEPGDPDRSFNRGVALLWLGRLDAALESLQAALRARPQDAECHFCIANVYKAQGQLAQAQSAYQQALEYDPKHLGARNNLGNVLQASGQLALAQDCFRELLIDHPDNVQAHHNLASVLNQQGRVGDALVHFNKALKADPDFSAARLGMAMARESLGEFQLALQQYLLLVDDAVHGGEARSGLYRIARFHCPADYDEVFSSQILAAIDAGLMTADSLARSLARQWLLKAKLSPDCLDYDGQVVQFAVTSGSDPLLLTLLRSAVNVEPVLEIWLTHLRRIFLFNHEGLENLLPLHMALAIQCFHNEFVFDIDEAEQARLLEIESNLLESSPPQGTFRADDPWCRELLNLACYQPLFKLDIAADLAAIGNAHWPAEWHELIAVTVRQPLEEIEIARGLPVLGAVTDPTSLRVRAQYEENPYPRWMALPKPREGGLAHLLARVLHRDPTGLVRDSAGLRILSAGCGTGQEALALAGLEPNAGICAVDLSAASLAYGQRKAASLGLDNVEFFQGDLLQLPAVHEQVAGPFDCIASSGVLHHLHNPLQGWQALVQVLRPGGLMKVALYSALARRNIGLAHERIRSLELPADAQGVRTFRQRILQAREPGLEGLLDSEDFYTTSTCRDLLFHVMEHCFDIPQIQEMLGQLGLEFLGFELAHPRIRQDFLSQYPHQIDDLGAWAAFESQHPDTFESMYVLWCRKPAAVH